MVNKNLIGTPLPRLRVTVERSAIERFAEAVVDKSDVYYDLNMSRSAGFERIPAPPTFPYVMGYWGAFRELQQTGQDVGDPAVEELRRLRNEVGGMIFHGGQEFEYHRLICAGDDLISDGRIVDVYERATNNTVMTFCTSQRDWFEAETGELVVITRSTLIHRGPAKKSTDEAGQ